MGRKSLKSRRESGLGYEGVASAILDCVGNFELFNNEKFAHHAVMLIIELHYKEFTMSITKLTALGLAACSSLAMGQTVAPDATKIIEPAGVSDAYFGSSLLLEQGNLIVGSPTEFGSSNQGSVHYFDPSTGAYLLTFHAPSGQGTAQSFGTDLAFDFGENGNLIVGGGGPYFYTIENSNYPVFEDSFSGYYFSTALDQNSVVVGESNGVSVFNLYPGNLRFTIPAPHPGRFGDSVAVEDNFVAVGAPAADITRFSAGIAYLYDATTGHLLHELRPPPAQIPASSQIGKVVSINDGIVAVSAPGDITVHGPGGGNTSGSKGSVYLFDTAGNELRRLKDREQGPGGSYTGFGEALAMFGDYILVGSPGGLGEVFLFRVSTGEKILKIEQPDDGLIDQNFGYELAVGDGFLAISSIELVPGGNPQRVVYVYPFNDCNLNGELDIVDVTLNPELDCNNNLQIDSCEINSNNGMGGVGGDLDCNANGIIDTCETDIPQQVEIVVVFDTSESMIEEVNALCNSVANINNDLQGYGFSVEGFRVLSTIEPIPTSFTCVTDSVQNLLGDQVPGGGILNDEEDWGDATAILADRYPWNTANEDINRIIVVISDEAPQDGLPCTNDDSISVTNAAAICVANNIKVVGVAASGPNDCHIQFFNDIALQTNGVWFRSRADGSGLGSQIVNAILESILPIDCDRNGLIDSCEIMADSTLDHDSDGILNECEQCLVDLTNDGTLNFLDVSYFLNEGDGGGHLDWNGDGNQNFLDVSDFLAAYGEGCI